jgi:salicylate hydroxylase
VRVAIIGAGIGGVTAAHALRQRGFEVALFERAPKLGEVGAGLQIGPNAVKVIRALGLERELRAVCAEPLNTVSLDWRDATLRFREPLRQTAEARWGAPYLTGHRADLLDLLLTGVPEAAVRLGIRCTGCEMRGAAAVARFDDGSEVEADVVVGADGIHSVVREGLFGADNPRFTRQICWRAMIPMAKMPTRVGPGGTVALERGEYLGWIGPKGHVICYPIRHGETLNIFAGRVSDSESWAEESWSVPSSRDDLLAAYAGWNEALLGMFAEVGSDSVFKWGIYDRDPLAAWTKGRITLLGDAAHPMMPTLAQGAAITIEDGMALARNLAHHADDPQAGLLAYEAERRPRASRVQLQARQQFLNNQLSPAPPPLSRDWIFDHDAAAEPVAA